MFLASLSLLFSRAACTLLGQKEEFMKKLTIAIALLVAALATSGQLRHRDNPLTAAGEMIQTDVPTPPCPPDCAR